MSRLLKLQGFAVLLLALLAITAPVKQLQAQPNVSVSFQTFYNGLQPYGQWVNSPQYGYTWVPNVGADFRPYYTNGNWAMTEYGNTWVSNYEWGWAPFHYGNWTYDNYYGWMWVPGTTWGPAWVSWRNGGGYYGWAPLAPGINVNVAIRGYSCSPDWWVFIPQRYIYSRSYHNHWRGPRYNNSIIRHTTIINNTYVNNNRRYVSGPRRGEVERVTGQRVRTYGVRSGLKPGRSEVRGNTLNVYRPNVNSRQNERPERYVNANERRTAPARATTPQRAQPAAGRPAVAGNRNQAPVRSTATRTPNSTPARTATPQRAQPARSSRPPMAANRNQAPARSTAARTPNRAPARTNTPQQQQRITERRQQSWQQRSQPARQNTPRANTAPQRSNQVKQRPQTTNRSTPQRARPQSRPQTTQRSAQPSRSRSVQRSAPSSNSRSSRSGSRGR